MNICEAFAQSNCPFVFIFDVCQSGILLQLQSRILSESFLNLTLRIPKSLFVFNEVKKIIYSLLKINKSRILKIALLRHDGGWPGWRSYVAA